MREKSIKKEEFKGPLFIIGNGRSGTTMLLNILNCNNNIKILDGEPFYMDYVYANRTFLGNIGSEKSINHLNSYLSNRKKIKKHWDGITVDAWLSSMKLHTKDYAGLYVALMKEFAKTKIKSDDAISDIYIGAKNPHDTIYLKELKKLYPQSKVINIIRDGRSVVASMLNGYVGPDNLLDASIMWKAYVNITDKYNGRGVLNIYYEDLLLYSEKTLKEICEYLGVSYDEQMKYNFASPNSSFNNSVEKGIDKNRVNRFEEILEFDEIQIIESILEKELKQHNYIDKEKSIKKLNLLFVFKLKIKYLLLLSKIKLKQFSTKLGIKSLLKKVF